MTSDPIHGRLVDLIIEMKDDVANELGGDNKPSCEVCGDIEFKRKRIPYECVWEIYSVDCPGHKCEGKLSFSHLYVEVGGISSVVNREFVAVRCSGDEVDGPDYLLEGIVQNHEPSRRDEFNLPVKKILTTNIHEHHTSYIPEETMLLCAQCHMKVHNDDEFRPDLQPEMSRIEWEEQKDD